MGRARRPASKSSKRVSGRRDTYGVDREYRILSITRTWGGSGAVRRRATVRDGPRGRSGALDFSHACARSGTVVSPHAPHGIQEVEGSTPFGSTLPFALAAEEPLADPAWIVGQLLDLRPAMVKIT